MKRVHFVENYLINPQHPITVNIIGVGGTGSQVITCLARLNVTLQALGHPGLFVKAYDPDEVSAANIGRQLFSWSDLGLNKAECMITRINRFFGSNWMAMPVVFPVGPLERRRLDLANITITCTDNIKSRKDLGDYFHHCYRFSSYTDYSTPLYWLDFGNTKTAGQVVLGTVNPQGIKQPESNKFITASVLKTIIQYTDYSSISEKDSGPSCSLAEALNKQDLFINSTLAQLGCQLLWKLFRQHYIDYHGLFLNLSTMKVNPIKI